MFLTGQPHLILFIGKALRGQNSLWCVFLVPSYWWKPSLPRNNISTSSNSDSETIYTNKINSLKGRCCLFFSPAETSLWCKRFPSLISLRWDFYHQGSFIPTAEWQSPFICACQYCVFIQLFLWRNVQNNEASLVCMESSRIALHTPMVTSPIRPQNWAWI